MHGVIHGLSSRGRVAECQVALEVSARRGSLLRHDPVGWSHRQDTRICCNRHRVPSCQSTREVTSSLPVTKERDFSSTLRKLTNLGESLRVIAISRLSQSGFPQRPSVRVIGFDVGPRGRSRKSPRRERDHVRSQDAHVGPRRWCRRDVLN